MVADALQITCAVGRARAVLSVVVASLSLPDMIRCYAADTSAPSWPTDPQQVCRYGSRNRYFAGGEAADPTTASTVPELIPSENLERQRNMAGYLVIACASVADHAGRRAVGMANNRSAIISDTRP